MMNGEFSTSLPACCIHVLVCILTAYSCAGMYFNPDYDPDKQ